MNTFEKTESRIILHYHSIEKGLLHKNIKMQFGKKVVTDLIKLLKNEEIQKRHKQSQIAVAYSAICEYYQVHQKNNCDISGYYSQEDYNLFKNLTTLEFNNIQEHNVESYFEHGADFSSFSVSRDSVRDFTGEKVPLETIRKVIELASTAPSVCNRQPTKVYYLDDKVLIEKIFDIQKGFKGYTDNLVQLLIVVSNRNYFYKVGERYQMFIDGGVFLMNLLYALHYYKIGACPAHWGVNFEQDKEIQRIVGLNNSEKVICLVPIGIPRKQFKTTLSLRRSPDEILQII
jgi:nitroreductase